MKIENNSKSYNTNKNKPTNFVQNRQIINDFSKNQL